MSNYQQTIHRSHQIQFNKCRRFTDTDDRRERERESTGAVEVAVAELDGVDEEVFDVFAVHTPHAEAHYRHLEAIVECYSHF